MGEWVSQGKAAKELKISQQYISKLIKQGVPTNSKRQVRVADVKGYLKNAKSEKGDPPDYWKERARREKSNADMAELDLKEKQSKLVEVAIVEKELGKLFTVFRQRVLAMPSKLTPAIQAEKTMAGVRTVLEIEANELLQELSTYDANTGKTKKLRGAGSDNKRQVPKAKSTIKGRKKN